MGLVFPLCAGDAAGDRQTQLCLSRVAEKADTGQATTEQDVMFSEGEAQY